MAGGAVKGDRVEIVIDTGNGTQTFEITATRAGRRVDISVSRGVVEVSEVTRGGTSVRTGRFMASRIIAMVEHPAKEPEFGGAAEQDPPARQRSGRRGSGAAVEPLGL
jgi:hypothetical protein